MQQHSFEEAFAEGTLPWCAQAQTQAMQCFRTSGIPGTDLEGWRYTTLADLPQTPLRPTAATTNFVAPPALAEQRIVLVDGRIVERPQDLEFDLVALNSDTPPSWVQALMGGVAEAAYLNSPDGAMAALNTALWREGLALRVPKGVHLNQSIEIAQSFKNSKDLAHTRLLLLVEEGAHIDLRLHHAGDPSSSTQSFHSNMLTEVVLREAAKLQLTEVYSQGFCLHDIHMRVHKNAACVNHVFALGTGTSRLRRAFTGHLEGLHSSIRLNGLSVLKGQSHIDHTIDMRHHKPQGHSAQHFRSIVDDKAVAVFQSKVLVDKLAQKTEATQQNKNLLLSKRAIAYTRPQLEIYADDVQCAHGATVGQLSDDELFYLRSRGIGPKEAERMLTLAFAHALFHEVQDPDLASCLEGMVHKALGAS